MMDYMQQAFAFDIRVRGDAGLSKEGITVVSHDIQQGTVFEGGGAKVTAFVVDHGAVKPAFGYRIDYGGHAVALSGDTRFSENLIKFAEGVDVLMHEAGLDDVSAASTLTREQRQQFDAIVALHTLPEQVGEVFNRVKPRLAVYAHAPAAETLIARTRKTYAGPLEAPEDMLAIEIGPTIEVRHFAR